MSLSNLDELALSCLNQNASSGIKEAIKCYNAGAYRAAIITTYVTVCFDLIEKLKNLAASGDKQAQEFDGELKKASKCLDNGNIQEMQIFERKLLERFKEKFEFFGVNEFSDLKNLTDDRNRCAHPSFFKTDIAFAPSAEQARLHIRNAVVHVLSQEPRQGKAALDELAATVENSYFPSIREDIERRLEGTALKSARPALLLDFTDWLMRALADKDSPLFNTEKAQIILEILIDQNRPKVLQKVKENVKNLVHSHDENKMSIGILLALRYPEICEKLDDSSRAMFKNWIEEPPPIVNRADILSHALHFEWLESKVLEQLENISPEALGEITLHEPHRKLIESAARKYSTAGSYMQANSYYKTFVKKYAQHFDEDDLRIIFSSTQENDQLRGSFDFDRFIEKLCAENEKVGNRVPELLKEYGIEQ